MRPVRADSSMPKGAISFMNESIRVGFAELFVPPVSPNPLLSHTFRTGDRELTPQQYSYSY
jgi:hypothetical protein